MSGVCWAQPPQLSHTVRGTKFHGLQFKAEGQETLTVRYTYLQLGSHQLGSKVIYPVSRSRD